MNIKVGVIVMVAAFLRSILNFMASYARFMYWP